MSECEILTVARVSGGGPCHPNQCLNSGDCIDYNAEAMCYCRFPYIGSDCFESGPINSTKIYIGPPANGMSWSFDPSGMPGLGPVPPFANAVVVATLLTNGTMIYRAVSASDPTGADKVLCQKGNVQG